MSESKWLRAERRAHQSENEPLTGEEEAWFAGVEAQDVQADRELAEVPWVPPHLRQHAPWLSDEYDPSFPSEAERQFHPESAW